jgi:transcriptional regulator with XRE-family HTH domain
MHPRGIKVQSVTLPTEAGDKPSSSVANRHSTSSVASLTLWLDSASLKILPIMPTAAPMRCATSAISRAAFRLGVRELAALADVAPMTISRLENEQSGGLLDTIKKIKAALESAGVIFIDQNGNGPGVRLRDRA